MKSPPIANMRALLKYFDSTEMLYVPYKMLCQTVHPSASTIVRYVVFDDDERPVQMRHNVALDDKRAVIWTITLAVLLALGVQEDLRRAKPNKSKLRSVAEPLGMTALLNMEATQN